MGYVPGYGHDVFVSYAHGDDREWLNRLVDRLETALTQRVGTKAGIWIDQDDLRRSRDFSKEIPDSVKSSAVFLLFPSPTYIRSRYCIDQECKTFADTIAAKRARSRRMRSPTTSLRSVVRFFRSTTTSTGRSFRVSPIFRSASESDMFVAGQPGVRDQLSAPHGRAGRSAETHAECQHGMFLYPPHPGA